MVAVPVAGVVALGAILVARPNLSLPPVPDPATTITAVPLSCPDPRNGVPQGLTPDAVKVVQCVSGEFPTQVREYGGVGNRPANVDDDHQTGRAVDIMLPGRCDPVGDRISEYLFTHQKRLGVKYIIWCDQIWSVARDREGWRPYRNPNGANDTLAHRDHVHVSVYGNQAEGTTETLTPPSRLPPGPPPPGPPEPKDTTTARPSARATPTGTPTPTATPSGSATPTGTPTSTPKTPNASPKWSPTAKVTAVATP